MSEEPPEVEQTEPHDLESAHVSHGLRWFLWPLLVLACYVLSAGPLVKYGPKSDKFVNVMEFVYTPLFVYAEKLKPVHVFLRWYIEDLWRCKGCVGTLTLVCPSDHSRPFVFIRG